MEEPEPVDKVAEYWSQVLQPYPQPSAAQLAFGGYGADGEYME